MNNSIDNEIEKEKIDNKNPEEDNTSLENGSKDQYQIIQNQESNIIANKIIQLLQEKLLSMIDYFNIDLLKKYDKEDIFDKETLEDIESELYTFKLSYIENQFDNINKILSDYNLIENVQNLSEEKTFAEELNSFDIKSDILSFIGPLSAKMKEIYDRRVAQNNDSGNDGEKIKDKDNKDNSISYEIEKNLFQLLQINFYNNEIMRLEKRMKELDYQIEDLKNKNKII